MAEFNPKPTTTQIGNLPHDLAIERDALVALLQPDQAAVESFFRICAPTDFYNPVHAATAAAISAANAEWGSVAPLNVWQKAVDLGFAGAFAAHGNEAFLLNLHKDYTQAAAIALPGYASSIAKLARRRDLILATDQLKLAAAEPELPKLAEHVEAATKAAELLKPRRRGRTAAEVLDNAVDEPKLPMPLPWKRLNAALGGGLPAANWSLLSAPPKRGKSCFVSACAAYWARHGKRVLIIVTEAGVEEVSCRLLAQHCGIGWAKLKRMRPAQRREAAPRPDWFANVTIVEHEPGDLVSTIVAGHIADTGERPIVIVDHLHDIAGRLDERDERRSIDLTSSDIKRCAQRERLTILAIGIQAIATISGESSRAGARANENVGKGSSRLAYDAAAVLAMSSEPFQRGRDETAAEITVAFCREAATVEDNVISLMMNGATGVFREVDAEQSGPRLSQIEREIVSLIRQREAQVDVGTAMGREAIRADLGKSRDVVRDAIDKLVRIKMLVERPGNAVALAAEVRS